MQIKMAESVSTSTSDTAGEVIYKYSSVVRKSLSIKQSVNIGTLSLSCMDHLLILGQLVYTGASLNGRRS